MMTTNAVIVSKRTAEAEAEDFWVARAPCPGILRARLWLAGYNKQFNKKISCRHSYTFLNTLLTF